MERLIIVTILFLAPLLAVTCWLFYVGEWKPAVMVLAFCLGWVFALLDDMED